MKPVALIDLDNCISNDKWRWPLFDLHLPVINERYRRYHDACFLDLHENSHIIRELSHRYDLVVATSRPEEVRGRTESWLHFWKVPAKHVLMRPDNNHEGSVILKERMLNWVKGRGYDVQYAIDDRSDILGMYADNGVRICRRVFINEPEVEHS